MTVDRNRSRRDGVRTTFFVVGQYPITIGTKLLQPGDLVQHVFDCSEMPAGWTASGLEVSLAAPEREAASRDPRGIVEWAATRR